MTIAKELLDLLGSDGYAPESQLAEYAVDGLTPQAAARPADREDIAATLRWASASGLAVLPRGGGTQAQLGNVPRKADVVLDLTRCARLREHQPADLTATAEAGITLAILERELAKQGQFVPLESPLAGQATIGGILATGRSGPLRLAYGLPRDWLIGIQVISADGVMSKAGGKVVKNVTGYDLCKLYTGSLGTLGLILEATFKLAPLPADSGMLVAAFSDAGTAAAAARRLAQSPYLPQGVQAVNGPVASRLGVTPHVVQGRAAAVACFAGRSRAVRRKLDESAKLLREQGAGAVERLDHDEGRALLKRLTDFGWDAATAPSLGLKIMLPPASVAAAVEQAAANETLGPPPGIVADAAFGQLQLCWWLGETQEWVEDASVYNAIASLRSQARQLGGAAIVEHCPLALKRNIDVWGDSADGLELMRRLKRQFDPKGILNPGRFYGRI